MAENQEVCLRYTTPLRFSAIEIDLYRGAYPVLRNFRFLRRLQIKTLISLTPEPPTADLQEFCQSFGIVSLHIPISRLSPLNSALQASLVKVINIVIDQQNLPIYVHCLDGRRITGLFVLLLRRLQGYVPEFSYAEFWRFQTFVSASYGEMERSSRDLDKFVNEIPHEIIIPLTIPRYLWDGDRNCYLIGLKLKYCNPAGESNTSSNPDLQERSYPNLPSSTSLSLMTSTSYATSVGQSTLSLNPSSTQIPPGNETTDQRIDKEYQSKERRPSLPRLAPISPSSDDLSSSEYPPRQLAALDLAHHRFNKRT